MEKPRFSVIMPLYNKAPYVKKALESIVSQTFNDWELIIVDDGSTDNSVAICEEYISTIKRSVTINQSFIGNIRIISQPNAGVAAARNHGVAQSNGEYVCFLDADDWWEPMFLEEIDNLIVKYPDAGIYCTNYVYYKPGKTHVSLNVPTGYMNYPEVYLYDLTMPVCSSATCLPKKVFDEMGGFPLGIKLGEDFLLWAKTALRYPIAYSENPLAYYNNDVPAHLRATRNLHAPEYSMYFHFDEIEELINRLQSTSNKAASWRLLLDKLRITGLMDYWLSKEYHDAAAVELKKVDWSKQSRNVKAQYEKPIWFLNTKKCFLQIGSYCKQTFIKLIYRNQ